MKNINRMGACLAAEPWRKTEIPPYNFQRPAAGPEPPM